MESEKSHLQEPPANGYGIIYSLMSNLGVNGSNLHSTIFICKHVHDINNEIEFFCVLFFLSVKFDGGRKGGERELRIGAMETSLVNRTHS